jgi:predicted dehydrogenase
MKKIRVANIGWFANDPLPECETVAFCDTSREKLDALAAKHPGLAMYTDYRDLLRHPGLDAVVISTPNRFHVEQALAAFDAGLHVMLEKPMGVTRAEIDCLLQAQRRTGRMLTIDFEMRTSPFARRVRALIDSGEYGSLRRLEFSHHRGCWLEHANGLWRVRPELSGGLFFMEPIHEVDIFRYFAGEVKAVQAFAGPNTLPQYRFEDNVCAHLFFESGVFGTLATTHTHSATPSGHGQWDNSPAYHAAMGHFMSMIFTLTGGSIHADMLSARLQVHRFEEWPAGSGGFRVVQDVVEDHAHGNDYGGFFHDIDAMRHEFIRRCARGEPPVQDPLDAWKSHVVCLAIEQSVREDSRRVVVDLTPPEGVEPAP